MFVLLEKTASPEILNAAWKRFRHDNAVWKHGLSRREMETTMGKKNTGTDKISFEAGVGEIPIDWPYNWFWRSVLKKVSDGKAEIARTKITIIPGRAEDWADVLYDEEKDRLTISIGVVNVIYNRCAEEMGFESTPSCASSFTVQDIHMLHSLYHKWSSKEKEPWVINVLFRTAIEFKFKLLVSYIASGLDRDDRYVGHFLGDLLRFVESSKNISKEKKMMIVSAIKEEPTITSFQNTIFTNNSYPSNDENELNKKYPVQDIHMLDSLYYDWLSSNEDKEPWIINVLFRTDIEFKFKLLVSYIASGLNRKDFYVGISLDNLLSFVESSKNISKEKKMMIVSAIKEEPTITSFQNTIFTNNSYPSNDENELNKKYLTKKLVDLITTRISQMTRTPSNAL